jgi:hypothetical protein
MPASASTVHRLKITLQDIRPPIWRRLLVPSETSLYELHNHIQTAFGWWDSHLHEFRIGSTAYASDDGGGWGWGDPPEDDAEVTLLKVASAGASFTYTYDFGDNWEHVIEVESIDPAEPGTQYPRCVAGRRAGPPEDCGGFPGYYELVEALADPAHPQHEELHEWVGGEFDPEYFDLDQINEAFEIWRGAQRS